MLRRLSAVAVAGAVSLVALAGCRIESPNDAAYVGNTRHSQVDVDKIVSTLKADGANIPDTDLGSARQVIVAQSVFVDVAKRYAAEKGYPEPPVDAESVAQADRLPVGDPFVQLVATATAYQNLLLSKVTPAKPTAADLHTAYSLLVNQQAVQPGSEAAVIQQLQQPGVAEIMASGVALRNELTAAMKRYGAKVNPRYLPIGYPLAHVDTADGQQSFVVVQLPLGGAEPGPVRDLPATAAPTLAPESAQ